MSVTNGVGTLSLINAISGACVERSPVVVIDGRPAEGHLADLAERDVVYSHSTGRASTELDALALLVAGHLCGPRRRKRCPPSSTARSPRALMSKRPAYIEINMGCQALPSASPGPPLVSNVPPAAARNRARLFFWPDSCRTDTASLVGPEIARYGLADAVADLIAKLGVRWASDMLAKSTLHRTRCHWCLRPAVCATGYSGASRIDQPSWWLRVPQQLFELWSPRSSARWSPSFDGKVRVKNQPKQNAEIRALVAAIRHQSQSQPPANVPPGAVPAAPAPAAGALTYQQAFQRMAMHWTKR